MIETVVTLFVVGFVAIAGYGHLLVARAILGQRGKGGPSARSKGQDAYSSTVPRGG
jgi:hypothetical protein